MLLRRMLLFAAALLLVAALASSLAPREEDRRSTSGTPREDATPGRNLIPAPVVRAALPQERVVKAEVGDVVELEVSAGAPEQVEIPKLGIKGVADVGLPARLTFVADRPGRFGVRLRFSGEKVGVVEVGGGT